MHRAPEKELLELAETTNFERQSAEIQAGSSEFLRKVPNAVTVLNPARTCCNGRLAHHENHSVHRLGWPQIGVSQPPRPGPWPNHYGQCSCLLPPGAGPAHFRDSARIRRRVVGTLGEASGQWAARRNWELQPQGCLGSFVTSFQGFLFRDEARRASSLELSAQECRH